MSQIYVFDHKYFLAYYGIRIFGTNFLVMNFGDENNFIKENLMMKYFLTMSFFYSINLQLVRKYLVVKKIFVTKSHNCYSAKKCKANINFC